MASFVQFTPPSLPYNLTIAPSKDDQDTLSPCQMPLPLSPPPSSPPPVYRLRSNESLKSPIYNHQSSQSLGPVAKLPPLVSKRSPKPRSPPPRPPRPQTSLPNLRPTVILSPKLLSALPSEARPSKFQRPHSPPRPHAPSPSSSYSSNSNEHFSTPLPSPAFFAPRTWPKHPPANPQTSPLRSTISSKTASPLQPSPTSPHAHYYNPKWQYENLTRDSNSITALPPPPLPPPQGPLPQPPSPPPKLACPKRLSPEKSPVKPDSPKLAANRHGRRKKSKPRSERRRKDTTSSHFIHEVRNAQKIQNIIETNAANAAYTGRVPSLRHAEKQSLGPHSQLDPSQEPPHAHPHHRHNNTDKSQRSKREQQRWHNQHSHPSVPELEGDTPITVDLTFPPPPPTFWIRNRKKFAILATIVLVLAVTAGILAGIIWKLKWSGVVKAS